MASTESCQKLEYKFNCIKCHYKTNVEAYFKIHQVKHPISYEEQFKVFVEAKYNSDVTHGHVRKFKFKCKKCDYKTNLRTEFNNHQRTHSRESLRNNIEYEHQRTHSGESLHNNIEQEHQITHSGESLHNNIEYEHQITHSGESLSNNIEYEHQITHSGESLRNNIEHKQEINSSNLHTNTYDDKVNLKSDHEKKSRCVRKIYLVKCTKCDYETHSKTDLINHEVTHFNGELMFSCWKCQYKTNVKSEFLDHNMKHSEKDKFQCTKCHFKTNVESHLKIHEINHSPKKYFHCLKCNFKTFFESLVKQHKEMHCNGTIFTKLNSTNTQTELIGDYDSGDHNICTEPNFLDQKTTFQDNLEESKSKNTLLQCESEMNSSNLFHNHQCKYTRKFSQKEMISELVDYSELRDDTWNILQGQPELTMELLDLSDLNYKSDTQKNLLLLQKELNGERLHDSECNNNYCRKSGDTKTNSHENLEERKFESNKHEYNSGNINPEEGKALCYKTFDYEMNLKNDISDLRTYGFKRKVYIGKCTKCDYETNSKCDLINHEVTHFNGEIIFHCGKCRYKTNVKSKFRVHELKHAREDVFHCTMCSFKTNDQTHIKMHEKNHHHKKIFSCTQCNYQTFFEGLLSRHKNKHCNGTIFTKVNSTSIQKELGGSPSGDHNIITEPNVSYREINVQDNLEESKYENSVFYCDSCNYKTNDKYIYVLHEMEHTGEITFHCSECSFYSRKRQGLTLHQEQLCRKRRKKIILFTK